MFASVGKPFVFPRFPYAIITSCIPAAVAALVVAGAGLKCKGGSSRGAVLHMGVSKN